MNNAKVENFLKSGYYFGNNFIKNNKIQYLRKLTLENFRKIKKNKIINFLDFNEELRTEVINLLNSNFIKNFLMEIEHKLNTDVSILPRIHIMKNYHVNRLKTAGIGWHRDCAGEFRHNYCNNLLSKKEYVFGKIGIYLQKNSDEIGGGIDLIPKSHIYIRDKKLLRRKISGIRLRIIKIIQKNFTFFYKLIPENFFMKFLKATRINSYPGDPVFFDSRVVHRGSPIKDEKIKDFKELDDIHYELEDKIAKISIYCEFGSSVGVSSALYDRATRKEYYKELQKWLEEIELYKKYSPELYFKSSKIVNCADLDKVKDLEFKLSQNSA